MAKTTRGITQANFTLLPDETVVGLMLGLLIDGLLAIVSRITSMRDLDHCSLGH